MFRRMAWLALLCALPLATPALGSDGNPVAQEIAKKLDIQNGPAQRIADALFSPDPEVGLIAGDLKRKGRATIPGFMTLTVEQGQLLSEIPIEPYVIGEPVKLLAGRLATRAQVSENRALDSLDALFGDNGMLAVTGSVPSPTTIPGFGVIETRGGKLTFQASSELKSAIR